MNPSTILSILSYMQVEEREFTRLPPQSILWDVDFKSGGLQKNDLQVSFYASKTFGFDTIVKSVKALSWANTKLRLRPDTNTVPS